MAGGNTGRRTDKGFPRTCSVFQRVFLPGGLSAVAVPGVAAWLGSGRASLTHIPIPRHGILMHTRPSHAGQLTRLRRIEGQVRGVIAMVEKGRYCVDILTQTRAIQAALRKVEEEVLSAHVSSCVVDAARSGSKADQHAKIAELMEVIGRFGR